MGWYGGNIRKEVIDMINKNIRIIKVPICSFTINADKKIKLDIQEYPCRLCVIDESKNIIVDIEHKLKYPYINKFDILKIKENRGKRIGFIQYNSLELNKLSSDELKSCVEVVKLLNQNYTFMDGNEILSNQEYLDVINSSKKPEKAKKL